MDTPSEEKLKCAEIEKRILDLKAEYRQSIEEKLERAILLIESKLNGYIPQVRATFIHLHNNIGRSDNVEEKLNNDENEFVNPTAEIRQLIEEASMSVTSSLESRMNEFISPVVALFDYLLTEKYIGRSDVQDNTICRREKFSILGLDYGDLDFLRENKEEEMFYFDNNFTKLIANYISDSEKFNEGCLKMAPFHYLSDVKLDTSVLQEFCHLLSNIFEEKNVEFIDPLSWKSSLKKVDANKSRAKPAKNFDMVLIGVLQDDHFFSIHVHMKDYRIFVMDSMVNTHQFYEKQLTNLVEYMLFNYNIAVEQWNFFLVYNSPQQENGIDCGVFMLKNMEFWAKGEKLPFTQGAKVARHILMLEVVEKKLADDKMIEKIFGCRRARKLLILDVNGLLADIADKRVVNRRFDSRIKSKYVYLRPNFKKFIEFCFKYFQVAIWSSRSRENLATFIKDHLSEFEFFFIWCNEECDEAGHFRNSQKPIFLKKLQKVWNKWPCFSEANTLLIDDSPYKGSQNIEGTSIFPEPFSCRNSDIYPLEPGSGLWNYLEDLAKAAHVSKYVKAKRYGAPHLSKEDPFWEEVDLTEAS